MVAGVLCALARKNNDHLLLHYVMAKSLWSVAFLLVDILWVMPRTVCEMLQAWSRVKVGIEWWRWHDAQRKMMRKAITF